MFIKIFFESLDKNSKNRYDIEKVGGQKNMVIKNGKVVIFENNDVIIKEVDIQIENDKIIKIQKEIEPEEDEKIIDASNKVVMPGLINTHTHIAMSIFRGTFEGCNLYTWLHEKIWPIEANLTKQQVYDASMLSILEMISTGTTCFNDHYFISEATRRAVEETKIRAMLTTVIMDNDGEEALKRRIQNFEKFYETRDKSNGLIGYTVSPHGLYTCSSKCLEEARKLALEYHLPVHVHFLESIDEIEDIKKMHGESAAHVLKRYFEDIHTILAHGVKLTNEDIEVLKTMDCGISHNPLSNLRLGCKIADTTKYLRNGMNVALGTDGQGSGNNLDMFEAMRTACLIQGGIHENEDRITSKEAIKMATINGAKLLGLEEKIGSIEEGKEADIILIDIAPTLDNITKLPNNDILSNLVYNTNGRDVDTTIVKGKILMENRKITVVNTDEIIEKFQGRKI